MSLRVVTGGAGTGKTTRLISLVDDWLAAHTLTEGQRVLALTFMHGSRIRLSERLQKSKARGRFDCVTLDGFARQLCGRWRSRVAATGLVVRDDDSGEDYDAICQAAADLLADPMVVRWVAGTHPLILVDEFQDCRGARPVLVEHLSTVADVLLAADPFQDLSAADASPAVQMLERSGVKPDELTQVHRTEVPALLAAATALRTGQPLIVGRGLALVTVPKAPLGAWEVCKVIAASQTVSPILIAAGTDFATKVIERVGAKSCGKKVTLGPYPIPWERSPDTLRAALTDAIGLGEGTRSAEAIATALPEANPLSRWVLDWLARERRLRGRTEFSLQEVRAQLPRAAAFHRAQPRRDRGRRAMNVHQAKNREFRRVIVLWGFGVPTGAEIRRRWLYNAITRAREAVTIIVEDPGENRLNSAPFA